ncbi:MAG TPA: cytochrome c [Rhodothermales bacterium]
MNRRALSLALSILALSIGACGTARRGAPVQEDIAFTDSSLVRGERVFMHFCNGCHPGGDGGLGLALNNKPLPAFLIRFQIRKGLGAMPGFSDDIISDEEVRDVARYLVAVRHWE